MVFEHCFKLCNEVGEGSNGDNSTGDSILLEGGCPGEGGSFGHVRQSKGDFLVVIIIDLFVDEEVESYGIQPLGGLFIGSVKGFWCSNTEFSGF